MDVAVVSRPLDGIRVLACEQFLAGPYGSMVLAAYGADVLRVERPPLGEVFRVNVPAVENERGRTSYGLLANNLNKRSIVLDLQQEKGREIFRDLARKSDVVWENNRPGIMDRLGLGYRDLNAINPRLVYVSVSGYGQQWASNSPYTGHPAYDILAQAMGGLMMRSGSAGDAPIYNGYPLGDQFPSILAALGCVMALRGRDVTGVGQHVDISMYDAMASLMSQTMSQYVFAPEIVKRGVSAASAPYGAYAASDGYFVVAVVTEPVWKSFCELIGHADMASDPNLQTGRDRAKRSAELKDLIETWASDKKVDAVVKVMADAGVPVCKVQDLPDLLTCPHLAARDMVLQVNDPVAGMKPVMGFPIRLSGSSPRREPPPQFGQHTDEVLRQDLGLSDEQIHGLRSAGIVK